MSNGNGSGPEPIESPLAALQTFTESDYASTSAAAESFRSNSDQRADPNPSNPRQPISSSEDERIRLLRELENTVESFRSNKISKTNAISSILRVLGEVSDVSITQSQKEATFDSYLTEILSIQATLDDNGGTGDEREEPERSKGGKTHQGTRRTRDTAESESDDDDASGSHSKKQKLHESDMPWFTSPNDESISNYSNPSCKETCRLLRAYNRDISKAKFYIKIAPNSPSGIPSSQWERILKGDAVDLNQIFASLHHVIPDEERTGRLGDAEISFGVAEAKKRVSTAAEWSTAWRRASRAITFAFPHRREELIEYGDYIESEFAAKLAASHHKLLLYDIALRNEVAAGQHFLLTDFHKFSRLYSAIVMPDGIESGSAPGKPNGKKPKGAQTGAQTGAKPEICNKFNAGTCKNTEADCKYRHLCKGCKKPGHANKDCPDGPK
jgi:hypothetical protein